MATTDMTFGQALVTDREARGMSQADLIRALNLPQQSVSKWERDLAEPRDLRIAQLMEFFGPSSNVRRVGTALIDNRRDARSARARGRPFAGEPDVPLGGTGTFAHTDLYGVKRPIEYDLKADPDFADHINKLGGINLDLVPQFRKRLASYKRKLELESHDKEVDYEGARREAMAAIDQLEESIDRMVDATAWVVALEEQKT